MYTSSTIHNTMALLPMTDNTNGAPKNLKLWISQLY